MANLDISAEYNDAPSTKIDHHNSSVTSNLQDSRGDMRDSMNSNQGGFPMGRRKSAGTLTSVRPTKKI